MFCVPDATQDPRFADNPLVVGDFGLRFYAGVPITGPGGQVVGALCIIDREPRNVSKEMLDQLKQLAVGVGSALKLHASVHVLQKPAVTDPLTGLENRTGFDKRLPDALTARPGLPAPSVGMLSVNLDGFRFINDLFEHTSGDTALREVAERLRKITRVQDVVCRFESDEFCILVTDVQDITGLESLAAYIHCGAG